MPPTVNTHRTSIPARLMPAETRDDDPQRFARQLALPEIGPEGQQRLRKASVCIVGLGGLGSPAAFYLAAAGVGHLDLVDGDRVDLSNLQRQILYTTADVGRPKVEAAADRLRALNPGVALRLWPGPLTPDNADEILTAANVVIDATDSPAAKFLIADRCHDHGRPYVHGGITAFTGQLMTVLPGRTACCRCLFDAPPPTDGAPPRGPLGVVPGVIGTLQATEAIKVILGIGDLLCNRMLVFDALRLAVRTIPVRRRPGCPLCGQPTSPPESPTPAT